VIGAMTRHEIQILRAVGMAQTAIAAKTRVSALRDIRSIARCEPASLEQGVTPNHEVPNAELNQASASGLPLPFESSGNPVRG